VYTFKAIAVRQGYESGAGVAITHPLRLEVMSCCYGLDNADKLL